MNDLYNHPRDKFVVVNGLKLNYLEWGNQKQETILMLHGFANCAATWIPIAGSLAADRHVLALDQRGHGDSQWADPDKYRMSDFVSDLLCFIEALEAQRITIIGHSLGGAVAQYFAATCPGKIDRLVIVDNGPELGEAVVKRIQNRRNIKRSFTALEEVVDYLAMLDPFAPRELLRWEAEHLTRKTDFQGFTWKCHMLANGSTALPAQVELAERWEVLGLITCPTLILRGEKSGHLDRAIAEEMVKTLPLAELVEVERAGHFIHRDNPGRFNELIYSYLGINT